MFFSFIILTLLISCLVFFKYILLRRKLLSISKNQCSFVLVSIYAIYVSIIYYIRKCDFYTSLELTYNSPLYQMRSKLAKSEFSDYEYLETIFDYIHDPFYKKIYDFSGFEAMSLAIDNEFPLGYFLIILGLNLTDYLVFWSLCFFSNTFSGFSIHILTGILFSLFLFCYDLFIAVFYEDHIFDYLINNIPFKFINFISPATFHFYLRNSILFLFFAYSSFSSLKMAGNPPTRFHILKTSLTRTVNQIVNLNKTIVIEENKNDI